ncbi:MAG: hypothetical protein HOW73_43610 [Polyangiaceae bacterium]|nr:hypothetical protein [Polyangiaceae bacterium]
MKKIAIRAYVSPQAAARAGVLTFGETLVEPSEQEWAAASPAVRELALKYLGDPPRQVLQLPADASASWDTVIVELERQIKADDAARVEEAARIAALVMKVVDAKDEDLIRRREQPPAGASVATHFDGVEIPWSDPRLTARHAHLTELAAAHTRALRAAVEERVAAIKAKEAEDKRRKEELTRECSDALRAYAIEHVDHLARAAKDGYEVGAAVIDHLAERIGELANGSLVLIDDSKAYADAQWEERKAPHSDAFRVYDEAHDFVKKLAVPRHVHVEVGRIVRFRSNDDLRWSTAVLVYIECIATPDRVIVLPVEPLDQPERDFG